MSIIYFTKEKEKKRKGDGHAVHLHSLTSKSEIAINNCS